ncbi:MAG: VOC family protein [Kofleriaceae bacterium]
MTNKLTTFLWFNDNALEAATLYCKIFDGKLSPMSGGASFEINGQRFVAFNGGPMFKLTPAVSIYVSVKTQDEVDALWSRFLAEGGTESRCGWLTDKFGLSWQIIPDRLMELLTNKDAGVAQRAQQAMLKMQKIVIADLERAAANV